mgnify:CR=1 FL=1
MAGYYMAIDIERERGRQVIGFIENSKLQLVEVHRFDNRTIAKDGKLIWDFEHLYEEMLIGLQKCWDFQKLPVFIGIASWGEDFVLLDEDNKIVWNPIAETSRQMDTIQQLHVIKEEYPECLEKAKSLLFIADYLSFLLCGVKSCEYTNASSSFLVDTNQGIWNDEMIQKYGLPRDIFLTLCPPGIMLSNLIRNVTEEIGYDCIVSRVEGNRKNPNPIVKSIAEKTVNMNPDEVAVVGSITTMMIRGHQFKMEEEVKRIIYDYFAIDPEPNQ